MKKVCLLLLILFAFSLMAEFPTGARYLIICPDDYVDELEPFAQWKTQKGVLAKIVSTSETGESTDEIGAFIREAHESWEPAPEYILIVAQPGVISIPRGTSGSGDCVYGKLDGDMFFDLPVGRFPARNETDVSTIINKVMMYEKDPPLTNWLKKGCTLIRNDGYGRDDPTDSIYYANRDTMHQSMMEAGYVYIDSLESTLGDVAEDVVNVVNDGRGFLAYRGQGVGNWWNPFNVDPYLCENDSMTPFVLSITCRTIDNSGTAGGSAGSMWLNAGSPDTPQGGVGFFGTTSVCSHCSHLRAGGCEGFVRVFFSDTTNDLGDCAEAGRMAMWNDFADPTQYESHCLNGDPEMDIRTDVPEFLVVNHVNSTNYYAESFEIQVFNSYDEPVQNALVCIMKEDDLYSWGETDSDGMLILPLAAADMGTLTVTVTAHNYIPYESTALLVAEGPYMHINSVDIRDFDGGNNNGKINPGETIDFNISLVNIGIDPGYEISATLSSDDGYATVTGATNDFGDVEDGDSTSFMPFTVSFSSDIPKGHIFEFDLTITDSEDSSWIATEAFTVDFPNFMLVDNAIFDRSPYGNGNYVLETSEGAFVNLEIACSTDVDLGATRVIIESIHDYISVESSVANFDGFASGVSLMINSEQFFINLSGHEHPSGTASMKALIESDAGTYTARDTINFLIPISGISGPQTGPDAYGYYMYDDTDVETGQAPTYEWFDISELGDSIPGITDGDDAIISMASPFTITYYGIDYDTISVSTNGFICMGVETWSGGGGVHEQHIPQVGQAAKIVAPFWDDLDHRWEDDGDVFFYYDEENHRAIIQYDEVLQYGGDVQETFQIIIYDEEHYPTTSGDTEILFQYETVSDISGASVGFEDETEERGLEYVFHLSFDEYAERMEDGSAILITTEPPILAGTGWVYVRSHPVFDTLSGLGNADGNVNPGETCHLFFTLFNGGEVDVSDVSVSVTSTSPLLNLDDEITFGSIAGGASRSNLANPFVFVVSTDCPDTTIRIDVVIEGDGGDYYRETYVDIQISELTGISLEIEYVNGWNLVTVPTTTPVAIEDIAESYIAPAFIFNTGTAAYEAVDSAVAGNGIWILSDSVYTVELDIMTPAESITKVMMRGWNLLGGPTSTIDPSIFEGVEGLMPPSFILEDADYVVPDSITIGNGFWLLSNDSLSIEMP